MRFWTEVFGEMQGPQSRLSVSLDLNERDARSTFFAPQPESKATLPAEPFLSETAIILRRLRLWRDKWIAAAKKWKFYSPSEVVLNGTCR
jgi:hypothetical protein